MPKTNIFVRFLGQNCRIKSVLNAELYELKKTSKTCLYKYQKEDMHSDSHPIFDRTQLSAAVESVLCNCPILRLHTGDKPYKTSNSL